MYRTKAQGPKMSSNKQEYTDLDLAEDEFFSEFEEKNEKPSEIEQNKAPSLAQPLSSKSNFFKPHDVRSVNSAMNDILAKDCAPPPILTPSVSAPLSNSSSSSSTAIILEAATSSTSSTSKNTLKRSLSVQQTDNDHSSKFKKLDDKEFTDTSDLDNLEDALFAEYMAQEVDEVQEDDDNNDATCPNSLDDSDDEDDDERYTHNIDETDPITCKPCSTDTTKFRPTDNDAKQYAFHKPFMFVENCNSECKYGGTCVEETTMKDMRSMVNDFWDEYECDAPSAATRRLKIIQILRSAYRPNTDEFEFYAGCKEKNNRAVCEAAYLIMLGLSNSPHASKAPGQWRRIKKYVREGKDLAGIKYSSTVEDTQNLKMGKKNVKKNNAVTFIQWFSKEFGDTIPGSEGK